MLIDRRSLLVLASGGLSNAALTRGAQAQSGDPRMSERSFGHADAPVTVAEYFSLTCTHCAAFSRHVMPDITAKLINTGKVRMVYHDFPLDQVALTAAMVARALPPERYEPFISALFASQDRWAFARGVNSTEELAKMALLAGMSRTTFDATIADQGLRTAILEAQRQAEAQYHIDSTPTFVANGKTHSGELTYDAFAQFAAASG
jgi:protein-disulfide isomerase